MSNEKKITEEQNTEEKGFWTKNIISILLIIFLIVSGVYAFNRDTEQKDKSVEEKVEDIKKEEEQKTEQAMEENKDSEVAENDKDDTKKVEDIKKEEEQKTEQAMEENKDSEVAENDKDDTKKEEMSADIQKTETKITLKAQNGDGVTHLARKAIAEYTKDKDIKLSKEQKLYAETVLKDKNYKHHLNSGQEVEFDVTNLSDTIQKAQDLSEKEIKAWSKYTHLVASL